MYQGNIPTNGALIGGNVSPSTPIERLRFSEKMLKDQLENVQAAIKALDENPDLNHVLTTLLKVNSLSGIY